MQKFSNCFHDTSTLNSRSQNQHDVQLFVSTGLASFCLTLQSMQIQRCSAVMQRWLTLLNWNSINQRLDCWSSMWEPAGSEPQWDGMVEDAVVHRKPTQRIWLRLLHFLIIHLKIQVHNPLEWGCSSASNHQESEMNYNSHETDSYR